MNQVTADNLKSDVDAILQRVQDEGEQVEVIRDGEVVARIVPVGTTGLKSGQSNTRNGIRMEPRPLSPEERERFDALWKEREDLAKRIARYWPDDLTAVDALREGRRDL